MRSILAFAVMAAGVAFGQVPKDSPMLAMTLWEEYGQNSLAADKKYKDKTVSIRHSDVKVKKDGDKHYVACTLISFPALSAKQFEALPEREKTWFRDGAYPPNVHCYLSKDGEKMAADLKPGDVVIIRGKVVGTKKAEVFAGYVVVMEDCTVEVAKK